MFPLSPAGLDAEDQLQLQPGVEQHCGQYFTKHVFSFVGCHLYPAVRVLVFLCNIEPYSPDVVTVLALGGGQGPLQVDSPGS